MALPFLPGNSFNPSLGKTKYHKSHHFDYNNEVAVVDGEKPGIGGEILRGQIIKQKNSSIPTGNGTSLPAWVAFDKQVLCFDAYFQEAVHEKREEQYRVRKCKIYFYLEDDSIQVIEPRYKNAGVPQGTLIRRHRVPRSAPNDDMFYTVEDFNVGQEVTLYGRTFKITGCDQFTENFLGKLGVRVGASADIPNNPYSNHRKALDESMQPLRPYEKHDTLRQFLDHDRHVLRFFCFWDDSDQMFGDPREMVMHYFLADDTLEIREVVPPNSGRDAVPCFLRRSRLPKIVEAPSQPGVRTDRTVLNVFGPLGQGGRYILDSLKTGAVSQEYYKDSDLVIGAQLNVWGRKFTICDCDDFTREYYRAKYGINEFQSITYKQPLPAKPLKEVPPYNGFGSEEDSYCSCLALLPKPPRRDFVKFMEKDRRGLDSNVLRYLARLETTKPIDADRRFIISYFLSDDTILVFEPPVRNSGIIGGKFLERSRVKKPNQEMYSTKLSEYFQACDLHVGATVEFNKFRFQLVDADEYAYNYMERHPAQFRSANVHLAMDKLKHFAAESGVDLGTLPQGIVEFEQYQEMVNQLAQSRLTAHEIITIGRYYQEHKTEEVSNPELVAMIQEQLHKANFEDFSNLMNRFLERDSQGLGRLCPDDIRNIILSMKVPVEDDMLRELLNKMQSDDRGALSYTEVCRYLNWREHAVSPIVTSVAQGDSNWKGEPRTMAAGLQRVNFGQLVKDLGGRNPADT